MKTLVFFFGYFLLSVLAIAQSQGVRFDAPPIVNGQGKPIANVNVFLCAGSATITGTTCSVQAQSFTDATLSTQCSSGFPVTPTNNTGGAGGCSSTSDSLGNFGFWLSPGAYIYCLSGPNVTGKCYNLTVPTGPTVITVDGTSTTLQSALTACQTITTGCQIFVPKSQTVVSSIVYTPVTANPVLVNCLTPGDVNQNTGGVTITYTPAGTNTTFLTVNDPSRFIIDGCNFTQGNSNVGTNGIVYNGVQGGGGRNGQIYNFSGIGFTLSDASNSSAEYNTFINWQVNQGLQGTLACLLNQANGSGKAVNQNSWYNSTCKGGSTDSFQMLFTDNGSHTFGSISENYFNIDVSGNATILNSINPGNIAGACRNNIFETNTIEASPPTISSATEVGTTVTLTFSGQTFPFAVGQSVVVSGVGVGGYNGTFTLTAATGLTVQYTAGSGLGNSSGGTVQTNNQVGFDINGCQMTRIQSEAGLTGPGTPLFVNGHNGATWRACTGASVAPTSNNNGSSIGGSGVGCEEIESTWQRNRQGSIALGVGVNTIVGTPPSINATGGTALCSGGCPFQWGSTSAIVTGNHSMQFNEGTSSGAAGSTTALYADSTSHTLKSSYNNGSFFNVPQIIGSGTATMTTAAITAGNCGTTVTVAATGVATTDTITWAFNAAPAGSNAGLVAWPTTNNVNFAYCSNTAQTPAAATINWRVVR